MKRMDDYWPSRRKLLRWLLCGSVLLSALSQLNGCAVNPVTGRSELALMQMSSAQEAELGMRAFPAAIQQMGGEVRDLQLQGYVQRVGRRVADAGHRPELDFQFRVVNQPTPNAFALPGGYIVITRGLMVHLENEAQLAAVLGHEVAHVTARHAAQGIQRGTLAQLAVSILGTATSDERYGALAVEAGQLGSLLIENSFSREQERESDRLGIDYMVAAGYDPLGAIELQEVFYLKLDQEQQPDWLNNLFRTHPFSKDRLAANRGYVQAKYPVVISPGAAYRGEEAYLRAIRSLRETEAGYQLYSQAQALEAAGEPNLAIETLLEALRLAPDEAILHTAAGLAYLRQEDLITARRYLSQAVALSSDHYQPYLGLGYVHLKRQNYNEAIRNLQRSQDLLATAQGLFLLAEAYDESGQRDEAIPRYRGVAESDPRGKLGQAARQRLLELGAK